LRAASRFFTSRTLSTTSRCASNATVLKDKTTWPVNCEVAYTRPRKMHQKMKYGAPEAFANPITVTCLVASPLDPLLSVETCKHSGTSHQSMAPLTGIAPIANNAKLDLTVLKTPALLHPTPRISADSAHSRSQYVLPARRVGVRM